MMPRAPRPPARHGRPGSVPEEPGIGQPALADLETEALVQAQRPSRILGIDPEARLGHAGSGQAAKRLRGDGAAQPPASPRPAHADVLEPSALHADRGVLL